MANYLTLVEQLSTAVDQLSEVLQGDENTTVTINGQQQPSVQKKTLDEVNAKIQLVLDAAADIDAVKYATTAAGIASGSEYFSVVSENDDTYLDLYQNESGTAKFKKKYPSIDAISNQLSKEITGDLISGSLVSALNGQRQSNENYKSTGFIKVSPLSTFFFEGYNELHTGLAFYDENYVFLSGVRSARSGLYIVPEGALYLIATTDLRVLSTLKIKVTPTNIRNLEVEGKNAEFSLKSLIFTEVDIFSTYPLTDGYIRASDGEVLSSTLYKITPFIAIKNNALIEYTGRTYTTVAGVAVYDKNKALIEAYANKDGDIAGLQISINQPDAAYIRVCSSINANNGYKAFINLINIDSYVDKINEITDTIDSINVDITKEFPLIDGYIRSSDGAYVSATNYKSTPLIAVTNHTELIYTGKAIPPTSAITFYDRDLNVLFTQTFSDVVNEKVKINNPNVAYMRACCAISSINEFSLKTAKYNITGSLLRVIDESETTEAYLQGDGTVKGSSLYRMSDFIPLPQGTPTLKYTGRIASPAIGIAVYDKDFNYLTSQITADGNYNEQNVIVSNADAKYIRACSSINSPAAFKLDLYVNNNESPKLFSKDIVIRPSTPTSFSVLQKVGDEYLEHTFKYLDRPEYTESGWYSPWVRHAGVDIAQGNFNFIHVVSRDGESGKYVGLAHGCEVFKWIHFFVDGKPFDPNVNKEIMEGDRFHFEFLADIYAADSSKGGGEFTYAKEPLELSSIHYMNCEITKYGVRRYNKLVVKRDNTVFNQLMGAMQQTNQPPMNGMLIYNAAEPFRVYFPNSNDVAEPLTENDRVAGNANAGIDMVKATGSSNGFDYTVETKMWNADCSKRKDIGLRSWTERTSSNKMYFIPEIVEYTENTIGRPATIFNVDDIIECHSETKYGVNKI
ncbi:hypothetical protein H5087_08850 [Pseudoalteromonas sp. SR43-7]|uniref:hypothetical protein n=1 Tax=Pseudoalteromonas sp. SR43-7 TaxID=2760939 RepID=UPI0015FE365F|nr:hypothetical protein [Pseudoalteromonas sp. SR43-7]MBB1329453.1 hypothetical protein [Pseudoalteromonas sp. SR43-7]